MAGAGSVWFSFSFTDEWLHTQVKSDNSLGIFAVFTTLKLIGLHIPVPQKS